MSNRIARKYPLPMEEVMEQFIHEMKLAAGLNTHRIFEAWDEASGAGRYTLKRFFRDGKLYITLSSSAVRSTMMFQRAALKDRINAILLSDPLFTRDDPRVSLVQEIILR